MNNETFFIRQETLSDIFNTQQVIQEAFANVKESSQNEHQLVNKLRNLPQFIPELSLVAESVNGLIVGHVLLSQVEIVSKERTDTLLALAPLSVLPSWQNQGVGSALVLAAHREATRLNYKGVVVLGHPGYYSRFGYKPASDFGIMMPFPDHLNCCLALPLRPNSLDDIKGNVVYPKVFFE